jgi:SEC-C motif-containing protein
MISGSAACPCSSGLEFGQCCEPYLAGTKQAPTPEALMRSRYSAYALGKEAYLLSTWHASTRPTALDLDGQPAPKWIGRRVQRHEQQDENHAIVEFIARYKLNGRAYKMQENSRFVKENGRWYYVEGDIADGAP